MTLKRLFALVGLFLLFFAAVTVQAGEAYNYDSYNQSVPSAEGYKAVKTMNFSDMGITGLTQPSDMCTAGDNIYLLTDSGVAVLDENFKAVKTIETFMIDGQAETLNNPKGIFVSGDKTMLIADTDNRRVLECDSDGQVIKVLTKPSKGTDKDNEGYLKNLDFRPVKVLYAGGGDIYVLVENCYLGILRYDGSGRFHGFFAANEVEATLGRQIDKLWKKLLTKQQQEYVANYVPVDYSSFDIGAEGFVYTVTAKSSSTTDEIRKLNNVGVNILRTDMEYDTLNRGDYGDRDKLMYRGQYIDSKLIDISVSRAGMFAALDQQRNRVFVYDNDSNLLFVFGGSGEKSGTFRQPCALAYKGDDILVLDREKSALTLFSPTDFGTLVLKATGFIEEGRYDLSLEPWQEVLRYDMGYESAYRGIGKAYLSMERYEEALPYLKQGYDREGYSKAYTVVRAERIQKWFYVYVSLAALLVLLVVFRKRLTSAIFKTGQGYAILPQEERPWYPMLHLLKGYEELRRTKRKKPFLTAVFLIGLWFIASLFMRQYTGFVFNMENQRTLNVILVFVRTAGIFLLWCVCAAGVSSMLEGEGNFRRIFIVSGYALCPMVLSQFLYVLLSNGAVYEEGALLNAVLVIGYLWSAWLLYYATKEVHQFSAGRTVAAMLMTVVGMLFAGLILVLVYGFVQQLFTFVMTVFNELTLRSL